MDLLRILDEDRPLAGRAGNQQFRPAIGAESGLIYLVLAGMTAFGTESIGNHHPRDEMIQLELRACVVRAISTYGKFSSSIFMFQLCPGNQIASCYSEPLGEVYDHLGGGVGQFAGLQIGQVRLLDANGDEGSLRETSKLAEETDSFAEAGLFFPHRHRFTPPTGK